MAELSPLMLGLIESGTDVSIVVTGNSMRPLWHSRRDTVVLTGCDPLSLKKGQIPLYLRENGQFVLHRIVKVHNDCYDMAGDHQTEIERAVPKQKVLCVVKAYTRNGKFHTCDDLGFRLYSFLWRIALPFRGAVFAVYRFLRNIFRIGKK